MAFEYIENVSFIIIARNEEYGIKKCLSSLAAMSLGGCEIICVDSGSTDKTVSVMCGFRSRLENLRIITVKGYSNAAIARNAGLRWATRDYVYFIDGDVEINPSFLFLGLQRLKNGNGAVTGKLRELQYSADFGSVLKEIPDRFHVKEEGLIFASGGCFLATRAAVEKTGLFDERLEKSQDYDFTLRLSRHSEMLSLPVSIGTHHTVGYDEKSRLLVNIRKLHALFFGTVIRRNIGHLKGMLWLFTTRERGIALGGLIIAAGIVATAFLGSTGLLAFITLIGADLFLGVLKNSNLIYRSYLHYIFPVIAFAGFLYTPDRRRPFRVEEVLP